jgi:2-methylisocitrate lyase-like PEP mutase family enzyme
MTTQEKDGRFAGLHVAGKPLMLYNAWDAGSAKAILAAGAPAVATSSWAVAAAQGYEDGEDLPKEMLEKIAERIAASVNAPVSVDFEGGYSEDEGRLAENVSRLIDLGIVGINFEDRLVKGPGMYGIDRQARRISAIRRAAEKKGVDLFINARTDLFLGRGPELAKATIEAGDRAKAYAAAGASGFFIPGLTEETMIGWICEHSPLPVNAMYLDGLPRLDRLRALGIARLSFGAHPYARTMSSLSAQAAEIYA